MNRNASLSLALASLLLFGCGGTEDPSDTGDKTEKTDKDGDKKDDDTNGKTDDETPPGPAIDQAIGTWTLEGSSACGLNLNGEWTGSQVGDSDFRFQLVLNQYQKLDCTIKATETSKFTCSDFSASGQIAPNVNCTSTLSITGISGVFVGNAVDITATASKKAGSGCEMFMAQAQCDPSALSSGGTIAH